MCLNCNVRVLLHFIFSDATNNIKDFISMDPEVGVGTIMDFWQFCDTFIEKDTS
jgi:hypothetical protein